MVADGFRWLGKIGRWEIEKWPQEDQFGKQRWRGGLLSKQILANPLRTGVIYFHGKDWTRIICVMETLLTVILIPLIRSHPLYNGHWFLDFGLRLWKDIGLPSSSPMPSISIEGKSLMRWTTQLHWPHATRCAQLWRIYIGRVISNQVFCSVTFCPGVFTYSYQGPVICTLLPWNSGF